MKINLRQEKGITGVDITLSIILISIFLGIILTVATLLQKNNNSIEYETEATYYAVNAIEKIKSLQFSSLPPKGTNKITGIPELQDGYIIDKNGEQTSYYQEITVKDYTELEGNSEKKSRDIKKDNGKNKL